MHSARGMRAVQARGPAPWRLGVTLGRGTRRACAALEQARLPERAGTAGPCRRQSPFAESARLPKGLIRLGAPLGNGPSDILELLEGAALPAVEPPAEGRPTARADSACRPLRRGPDLHLVTDNARLRAGGLTPQAVSSMLLLLELRGEVETLPWARYTWRRLGDMNLR